MRRTPWCFQLGLLKLLQKLKKKNNHYKETKELECGRPTEQNHVTEEGGHDRPLPPTCLFFTCGEDLIPSPSLRTVFLLSLVNMREAWPNPAFFPITETSFFFFFFGQPQGRFDWPSLDCLLCLVEYDQVVLNGCALFMQTGEASQSLEVRGGDRG